MACSDGLDGFLDDEDADAAAAEGAEVEAEAEEGGAGSRAPYRAGGFENADSEVGAGWEEGGGAPDPA